jgi:hypothetical protein
LLANRGVISVLLVWVVFALLQWSLVPRVDRMDPGGLPVSIALGVVLTLPPMLGAALAPWSFSRLRHR